MSVQEKPLKLSKQLRLRANHFLAHPEETHILQEILVNFENGVEPLSHLLTLEMIFVNLLKDKRMYIEVVPLKPMEKTPENRCREWLLKVYEDCFVKILQCIENHTQKVQLQGLSTAMNILSYEGRYPLEQKGSLDNYVPLTKLKGILIKILSDKRHNIQLINKYTEYLLFDDILFFTWKVLPSLTAKSKPNDVYINNYLSFLEKLNVYPNSETKILCGNPETPFFTFDESLTVKNLNKVWQCVMHWDHSPQTHKQLLILLIDKVLNHLERPLLLTDFLMDSLDVGGPVSLLALQGIFTLIQAHNLTYPNLYGKLYSMFEPEIFHTKYKARLFYLSDLFLSSTHLPESLVAAFAKRLARLALVAPSEDVIIICQFIGNLILRHPGLKCLLNNPKGSPVNSDPYNVDERDPMKSNAINSSLWELETLQNHVQPSVANAARFINSNLPSVEWDLSKILENTGDDIFDREIKKISKAMVLQFERPNGLYGRNESMMNNFWNL